MKEYDKLLETFMNGEREDKTLTCKDCGDAFVYSTKDQEFYEEMQFNPPKRCKKCRLAKKAQRSENESART